MATICLALAVWFLAMSIYSLFSPVSLAYLLPGFISALLWSASDRLTAFDDSKKKGGSHGIP